MWTEIEKWASVGKKTGSHAIFTGKRKTEKERREFVEREGEEMPTLGWEASDPNNTEFILNCKRVGKGRYRIVINISKTGMGKQSPLSRLGFEKMLNGIELHRPKPVAIYKMLPFPIRN